MSHSTRRSFVWGAWSCATLALGCMGAAHLPPLVVLAGVLRSPGPRAPDDPTVRGGAVLPTTLERATTWGIEPGGGVRATIAGLRLASWPDGVLRAAPGRLPADPIGVVALPERFGGGFLFSAGTHLWRSDTWLGPVSPIFTSLFPIADVFVGLDRAYARAPQGTLEAFDPRTGESRDLGPLPASPHIARIAAIDAWREVAVADLRGALVTLDAGSSWQPLGLPIEANDVIALGDVIAIGGPDRSRQGQWWAVGRDGQPTRLPEPPRRFASPEFGPRALDAVARIFRPSPLAAAIEDGWPLADGTALVLRDGAAARVLLKDGSIVESAVDAFPLNPARCHPLGLARPADPGAFGMVCGEPRGRTIVYRWDPAGSRLIELRRFDKPREVLAFGNGALAARGPCAAQADDERSPEAFCVMPPGQSWSEKRLPRDGPRDVRVVVLGDGRVALVTPPLAGDLGSAVLTVVDGVHAARRPIAMPRADHPTMEALRLGVWLDGFEERRPGVLGGWVRAVGGLLGVEVTIEGDLRAGELVGEGAPVGFGRWGLGWTPSRRGFETTDGGMTWSKGLDLPEPLGPLASVPERACGPVGCIAAGWMRIGWGSADEAQPPSVPLPKPVRAARPPPLRLECDLGPLPEKPPAASPATPKTEPTSGGTVAQFAPFCEHAPPRLRADERGFVVDASDFERSRGALSVGVLHAWGLASGDWDGSGRWQMRWRWPWGGCSSSAAGPAPWTALDAARRALGKGTGVPTWWAVAPGDDVDHALFIARHTFGVPTADVVAVETGRAPVQVRRPGGDAFPEIEGAVRIGGRWYLATAQASSDLPAVVVWVVDAGDARELARLPRTADEAHRPLRLARRTDGRSLGLAMEGELRTDGPPLLWMTSVDLDTAAVGEPEAIVASDLSSRAVTLCTGDDTGWRLAMPYPGSVDIEIGRESMTLRFPVARMRISRNGVCVESISGSWDDFASTEARGLGTAHWPSGGVRRIDVGVLSAGRRYSLVCSQP